MDRDEWLKRCAARYVERTGLDDLLAIDAATACFEAQGGEFDELSYYSPEDCADEDINNWEIDG